MKIQEIAGAAPRAGGYRFLVVTSQYNSVVTDRLLSGALETFRSYGSDVESVSVVRVPGALELPFVASRAAKSGGYDGILALGCVIRGETGHYDAVVEGVTQGLAEVNSRGIVPVIFGVLTTDTLVQALDRVGGKAGHKGVEGATTLYQMARLAGALPQIAGGAPS